MSSLEEAILRAVVTSDFDAIPNDGVGNIAGAVRAWAKENANTYWVSKRYDKAAFAVPLDKFGGDRHDDGSRKSGRGYDLRK